MSKKSIYEKPTEGVVLENGKVKEKFSFDNVEERTIDVKKTKKKQSKKKEESLEDYMQAQKELQEAFENLFLPEALEDQDTCVESLKTINDVLRQRGEKEKPWGDCWYKPTSLTAYDSAPSQ
jgi:hypothetical protein